MDFRDELYLTVLTVVMEAGSEPFEGQVAVAYVITHNRKGSIPDILFRSYQFSCWNTDSATRLNLDIIPEITLMQAYKATVAAYFKLLEDPGKGATHYLNEEMTRRMRGGTLPGWFDEAKVTARIGRHTFLKLEG